MTTTTHVWTRRSQLQDVRDGTGVEERDPTPLPPPTGDENIPLGKGDGRGRVGVGGSDYLSF